VTAADAIAMRDQAHSFKGAAANIGATGIADICQRLESLGQTGQLDPGAADDLLRLYLEVGDVDTRLRAILDLEPTAAG
jgi:HPt (histidine-containing phosphotransfer) domain-containing protein